MCQKQCRDANGFKCHKMSEGHQRQMEHFMASPSLYMNEYSKVFLRGMLGIMKNKGRVKANSVYQEYIKDKDHVHMSGTSWTSLTGFVTFLGRSGMAKVDTEGTHVWNGEERPTWWVEYIDRDPKTVAKQNKAKWRKEEEARLRVKSERVMEESIQRAMEAQEAFPIGETIYTEITREDENDKVVFKIDTSSVVRAKKESLTVGSKRKRMTDTSPISASALENHFLETTDRKKSKLESNAKWKSLETSTAKAKPIWIRKGIVVKVINKKLGAYHNAKGDIYKIDGDIAFVRLIKSKAALKIAQHWLETVVPGFNRPVIILCGANAGKEGVLIELNRKTLVAKIATNIGVVKVNVDSFSKKSKKAI